MKRNKKTGRFRAEGMWRNVLIWVLSLSFVLSLTIVMSPVTAMAATQADAKQYMDNCIGKQISSSRGNQCVELFNQYLEKVFKRTPPSLTYAYEIYDRSYSGWQKIPASSITEYKVGDIVVYGPGNGVDVGSAGHVALVYSVSNGKVQKLIEQNWANNPRAALYNFHSARLKGIIRPSFTELTPEQICETTYGGHDYKITKVWFPPTATESGGWWYECSRCGKGSGWTIQAMKPSNLKDGKYMIVNRSFSNQYVSVSPYESRVGGNIALYNKGVADQTFVLKKQGNGSYLIKYGTHNLVLSCEGGKFEGNVQLDTANGSAAQDWFIVPDSKYPGWYRIHTRSTYYNFHPYSGNATYNGNNIKTRWLNTSEAQLFKFIPVACDPHDWDNGVVTKKATYTEEGIKTYTCQICGEKKTEKIPIVNRVLKKPGNCHFIKWNDAKYTGCRIGWNKVDGADGYQTFLSWTDGSHASSTYVKSSVLYRDCTVHPQHVSQMKVRAYYVVNGQRKFGPWSNVEYITPSPTKLTTKNSSAGTNLKMNVKWNIIYGCNGYNVFLTTNPNGTWYWNQSTSVQATATSANIVKYKSSKLKKNTRYYVRIVTRRKRNGVFCTVPMPASNTYIGSFIIK